jgi:hypothetical protein
MIITTVMGGLGNQLFIYATSKALALKNNTSLKLDFINGYKKDAYGRSYLLDNFNLTASKCSALDRFKISVKYVLAKNFGLTSKKFLFEVPDHSFHHHFNKSIYDRKINSKTFLFGNWQTEKYFQKFEANIRDELKFKNRLLPENDSTANQISNSDSVALHLRRLRDPLGSFSNIPKLETNYYNLAVNLLKEKISKPHFFIFGDDTEWFRNVSLSDNPYTIVKNSNPIEDLQLMSLCKFFIISNSTFAWWGAWLSLFSEKIVITPSKKYWDNQDIIPSNWIIVD